MVGTLHPFALKCGTLGLVTAHLLRNLINIFVFLVIFFLELSTNKVEQLSFVICESFALASIIHYFCMTSFRRLLSLNVVSEIIILVITIAE